MQRGAAGENGMSSTDKRTDAVSSTAPAAVTQLRCGWGDRKNTSAPYDVWVSCTSVNHAIHAVQKPSISSRKPVRWARTRNSATVGGVPARIERSVTAVSRFENVL